MAYKIIDTCNNCRACEIECPNGAISDGPDIFVIDSEKCTECVTFHAQPKCAEVCPVEACITDDGKIETEAALLEKVKRLHPGKAIPQEFPSHFRN